MWKLGTEAAQFPEKEYINGIFRCIAAGQLPGSLAGKGQPANSLQKDSCKAAWLRRTAMEQLLSLQILYL
jgi:hypothetical protein